MSFRRPRLRTPVLVVAVSLVALAACTGDDDSEATSPTAPAATSAAVASTAAPSAPVPAEPASTGIATPQVTATATATAMPTATATPTPPATATAAPSPDPGVRASDIAGVAFERDIVVPMGSTVVWTNRDDVPHTVTADDDSTGSDFLLLGDTYSMTFKAPGTFTYYCTVHPFMTATVTIQ